MIRQVQLRWVVKRLCCQSYLDGTITCVLLVDSIILISFSYLLFNITQEVAFVQEEVSNSSSLMVKRKRKHTDLVSTDEVATYLPIDNQCRLHSASIGRTAQDMAAVAVIKHSKHLPEAVPAPVPDALPAPARTITKSSFYIARLEIPRYTNLWSHKYIHSSYTFIYLLLFQGFGLLKVFPTRRFES